MKLNLKGTSDKIVWRMIQVWFGGVIFGGVIVLAEVIAALVMAFMGSGYASVTVHLSEYLMHRRCSRVRRHRDGSDKKRDGKSREDPAKSGLFEK